MTPFAETVAGLAAELPDGHLDAWCEVLSNLPGPIADAPGRSVEAALITARPGHVIAAPAHRLVAAWLAVPLAEGPLPPATVDKGQPHIVVRGKARRHDGRWLVSLFLENRQPAPPRRDATAWIFQAELAATGVDAAAPRPSK